MPHIVIKLLSGRSEPQKLRIAAEVAKAVMKSAMCGEDAVSIAIEDVDQSDWNDKVFVPEIAGRGDTLYKKPGYKRV